MSFPNRGEGGGPRLGKNSHIFPFFFLATSLAKHTHTQKDFYFEWPQIYCSHNSDFMGIVHVNKWDFSISAFLTFSGHKFGVPDFYLLSTICGAGLCGPWHPGYGSTLRGGKSILYHLKELFTVFFFIKFRGWKWMSIIWKMSFLNLEKLERIALLGGMSARKVFKATTDN